MTSRNKDERAYVNVLVKAIQKNSSGVYAYIDRDAGSLRHTSSGWDFMLVQNGRVVFCEAKVEKRKLSDYQEYARAMIRGVSGTPYLVVRFWENGKFFTVDDGAITFLKIETQKATINNFL